MSDAFPQFTPVPIASAADPAPAEIDDLETATETELDSDSTPTRDAQPKGGLTKAAAKRVVDKYIAVKSAIPRERELLAVALGTKDDAVELATTISSSNRVDLSGLNDLLEIADTESPYEAVSTAFLLGKDGSKRVWSLMIGLGLATGALPAKDAAAAGKLAETASKLSDEQRKTLDSVRALARK